MRWPVCRSAKLSSAQAAGLARGWAKKLQVTHPLVGWPSLGVARERPIDTSFVHAEHTLGLVYGIGAVPCQTTISLASFRRMQPRWQRYRGGSRMRSKAGPSTPAMSFRPPEPATAAACRCAGLRLTGGGTGTSAESQAATDCCRHGSDRSGVLAAGARRQLVVRGRRRKRRERERESTMMMGRRWRLIGRC